MNRQRRLAGWNQQFGHLLIISRQAFQAGHVPVNDCRRQARRSFGHLLPSLGQMSRHVHHAHDLRRIGINVRIRKKGDPSRLIGIFRR
jgi:hypothetical protein